MPPLRHRCPNRPVHRAAPGCAARGATHARQPNRAPAPLFLPHVQTPQPDQDLQLLANVHKTASRSNKVLGELQLLKSRVHQAEAKVRNIHV